NPPFNGSTGALWVFVLGNSENSPGMDTWQLLGACGQVVVGGGCAGSMGPRMGGLWSVGAGFLNPLPSQNAWLFSFSPFLLAFSSWHFFLPWRKTWEELEVGLEELEKAAAGGPWLGWRFMQVGFSLFSLSSYSLSRSLLCFRDL